MSNLRVATSVLTNTIFAGKILKKGIWAKGKQDVTTDCLVAVAEHLNAVGGSAEILDGKGNLFYKITVESAY